MYGNYMTVEICHVHVHVEHCAIYALQMSLWFPCHVVHESVVYVGHTQHVIVSKLIKLHTETFK